MTKTIIHTIICATLFCSCNSNNLTNKESQNIKVNQIRNLISNIGFVNLPIEIDANIENSLIGIYNVNFNGPDSLVFDKDIYSVIGFLPDTTDYYAFLFHTVGDMLYPTIMTISKEGNKIDRQIICFKGCVGHAALDIISCYDSIWIYKDLRIMSISKVVGTIETDEANPKLLNICNEINKTGQINKNGQIIIKENDIINCDDK